MRTIFLSIAIVISFGIISYGQSEIKHIREGNRFYYDSAFTESEIAYRKALNTKVESEKAKYNLGAALYKQQRYDEAQNIYKELAQSEKDKEKLARYHHNLGNSYLKSGKINESIDAYKQALRYNPDDASTKYNLSYALKMQQQQQDQNQDNNQESKDQQKQNQQNQEQQENEQQQQQDQEQQQQQQQQERQAEISEEDARRLLEAIENEEKELQKKLLEKKKTKPAKSDKNW
jgi:tetratricopeptide (TPR) repeat protein